MKLRDGILSLALGMMLFGHPALAVIYPDEAPTVASDTDDENQDAISRFGQDPNQKRKVVKAMKPLDPISEASFEHASGSGRSPASMGDAGSRSPAGVVEVATDNSRPKKLIISQAQRNRSYQEVAVIANDTGFFPSTLFLTEGIPARIYITGASAKSQCFMLEDFGVRRQVRSQKIEEITFVPDHAGTYTFNCPMNGAKGTVVVKELEVGSSDVRSVPAAPKVSAARVRGPVPSSIRPTAAPRKSEINEDDFTPEFRNQ